MGFWDSAGKLAKEVAKDALDSAREIRAIHDRLESRSRAEKDNHRQRYIQQRNGNGKAPGTQGFA